MAYSFASVSFPLIASQLPSTQQTPPVDAANLKAMESMRTDFKVPVGFSDRMLGIHIPVAAVAMAACVIEKHLALRSIHAKVDIPKGTRITREAKRDVKEDEWITWDAV